MSSLPRAYHELPFQQIRLSHVPASSPTPTPVILLTLYRPGHNNAFTGVMMGELESAYATLSTDPRVKCVVVTGHDKMFCAGADLQEGFKHPETENARTHRDGGGRVALAAYRCSKPVIAAINGSAVGVGITMTLPMSIRIVSEKAKIGFVFGRRGIVSEACSSFFLPRLTGYGRAQHLMTTGAVYPATSGLFDGLFSEVLPTEKVLPRALEIAKDVSKNVSSVSVQLMKEMIWRNPGTAEGTHLLDSKLLIELFRGKDNEEGIRSFFEKRPANFTGTMEKDAPAAWPWWEAVDTTLPEYMKPKVGSKL